jgi:ribosome-associated heat shock protein Hsp15
MAGPASTSARIDRGLFAVRLSASRTLAAAAVRGGRVHVNGARVKPAHLLCSGDALTFMRGPLQFECIVRELPARRGPAREAALCYEETALSRARRAQWASQRQAAALTPRPEARPDKHARRDLRRLRGRI